jgi:hydrogenase expression/formation protein HypC
MCVAVPMKLVSIDGHVGRAETGGVTRRVLLDLVPSARIGDFVLVHAGYAIETLDEKAAEETLRLIREAYGEGEGEGE